MYAVRNSVAREGGVDSLRGQPEETAVDSPDGEDAVAANAEVWEERWSDLPRSLGKRTAVDVTFRAA